MEKSCKLCNNVFRITPNRKETAKFCSRKCAGKYRSRYLLKNKNLSSKGKYVKCEQCSFIIWRNPYKLKNVKNHFCSRECMGKWQSINRMGEKSYTYNRIKKLCNICGKEMLINKYKIKHQKSICCSRKCSNILRSSISKGKNNPHYGKKHSKKTKELLRELTIKQLSCGSMPIKDTLPEKIVENKLLINNILYIKQYPYKLGVADFWLPEYNIIIECDGDYWHNLPKRKQKDIIKTKWLENNDFIVYRFWESDIKNDIQGCFKLMTEMY